MCLTGFICKVIGGPQNIYSMIFFVNMIAFIFIFICALNSFLSSVLISYYYIVFIFTSDLLLSSLITLSFIKIV